MNKPHRGKGSTSFGKKSSSFGDRKPWERGSDGRSSGIGGKTFMHKAICSQCDKACQVPFVPNGSRPIYCSNCFRKDEYDDRPERKASFNHGAGAVPSVSLKQLEEQIKAIHIKLDAILKALAPTISQAIERDAEEIDGMIVFPQKVEKFKISKKPKS